MKQKTALVTGANKGIGFEISKQLGLKGFHVFVAGRDHDRLQNAVQELNTYNISVRYIIMDVSSTDSIQQAFDIISKECQQIDVLVNNAGILKDHSISLFDIDKEIWKETFDINSFGPYFVTKQFLPLLKSLSRIINISSDGGSIGNGINTWAPAYCISKSLLNIITMHMAEALKPKGITVNAMCPGWTKTDMGGNGATRSISQGAETAIWLATEKINQTGKFYRDKKILAW